MFSFFTKKDKDTTIFDKIINNPKFQIDEILFVVGRALSTSPPQTWKRINKILENIINFNENQLRQECYNGLPDLPSLRALIWKINFHYFPKDIHKWNSILRLKREEYTETKNALLLRQKAEMQIFDDLEKQKKESEEKISEENNEENNNININSLSSIAENTDRSLLETIDKDVNRTHNDMPFFNKFVNEQITISEEEIKKMIEHKKNCTYQDYKIVYTKGRNENNIFNNETHSDVIARILYVYAKLNKDVGYVQGMNEILSVIYYCYCVDSHLDIETIEADTFWSFSNLMNDVKTIFSQENDDQKDGIVEKISILDTIISTLQKDIYSIMLKNHINICHFAFTWINLFFCQHFKIEDSMKLWDVIFSENDRYYFVYFFSMAVLQYKKKRIEKEEFCVIVNELQHLKIDNIEEVIKLAVSLKKKYEKKVKEILDKFDEYDDGGDIDIDRVFHKNSICYKEKDTNILKNQLTKSNNN